MVDSIIDVHRNFDRASPARRIGRLLIAGLAGLLAPCCASFSDAAAQQPRSPNGAAASGQHPVVQPGQQVAAPSPPSPVVPPDADKVVLLVRLAILTLNDAIQTGNFTVLRDRGSPSFRDANSAARLSQSFSGLMSAGVDLAMVGLMVPQLANAPVIDAQRRLRITGHFPGRPVQIDFDLLFQSIEGTWRLFGLSVNPVQAQAAPPASAQPSAPQPAAPRK